MVTKTTIDVYTADDGTTHDTLEEAEAHERIQGLSIAAARFAAERYAQTGEEGTQNVRAQTRTINLVLDWERWQDAQVLASITDESPEAA